MVILLEKIANLLIAFTGQIRDFMDAALGPLFIVISAFKALVGMFQSGYAKLGYQMASGKQAAAAISDVVSIQFQQLMPTQLAETFAWLNYAIPVAEIFTLAVLMAIVVVISSVIRIVKSFLPLIA